MNSVHKTTMKVDQKTRESELCSIYVKIFFVVAAFWVVSIAAVFVNKTLFSSKARGLDAPMFISWFQCFVSFIICFILSKTGGIPRVFNFPDGTPWAINVIKKVLSLAVLFTLMIATNNFCLRHVEVSFHCISRSLTTLFNVMLSWLLLRQTTSFRCLLCCACILFGFSLGVDQEKLSGSFSVIGTVAGVVGSLILSLYSIYIKKVLPSVNQDVWLLTYYNNAYSIFLFLPLIVINGEHTVLWNFSHFDSIRFWIQMAVGAILGFAIGYVTALQIKVTSPLTHNISGTAKACAQTVMATQWYNESKNWLWWSSNAVVLASSALYARFKQLEMEQRAKQPVKPEGQQAMLELAKETEKPSCIEITRM